LIQLKVKGYVVDVLVGHQDGQWTVVKSSMRAPELALANSPQKPDTRVPAQDPGGALQDGRAEEPDGGVETQDASPLKIGRPATDPVSAELAERMAGAWVLSKCSPAKGKGGRKERLRVCGRAPLFGLRLRPKGEAGLLWKLGNGVESLQGDWRVEDEGKQLLFPGTDSGPRLKILEVKKGRLVLQPVGGLARLVLSRLDTADLGARLAGRWRLALVQYVMRRQSTATLEKSRSGRSSMADPVFDLASDGTYRLERHPNDSLVSHLADQGSWELADGGALVFGVGEAAQEQGTGANGADRVASPVTSLSAKTIHVTSLNAKRVPGTSQSAKRGPVASQIVKKGPVTSLIVKGGKDTLLVANHAGMHDSLWRLERVTRKGTRIFLARTWVTDQLGLEYKRHRADGDMSKEQVQAEIPPLSGLLVLKRNGRYKWSRAAWLPRKKPHVEKGKWRLGDDLKTLKLIHRKKVRACRLDGRQGGHKLLFSFEHGEGDRFLVLATDKRKAKRGSPRTLQPRAAPGSVDDIMGYEESVDVAAFLGEGGVSKIGEFASSSAYDGTVEVELQRFRKRCMAQVALVSPPPRSKAKCRHDSCRVKMRVFVGPSSGEAIRSRWARVTLKGEETNGRVRVFFACKAVCKGKTSHLALQIKGRGDLHDAMQSKPVPISVEKGVCSDFSNSALRMGSQDYVFWEEELHHMALRKAMAEAKKKRRAERKKARRKGSR
jgi:hypothetical protein